jgi:hypothetical protein
LLRIFYLTRGLQSSYACYSVKKNTLTMMKTRRHIYHLNLYCVDLFAVTLIYLHDKSLRSVTIFLVPLVILACQVCPIKLLLLPHACVCLYFNNLIYNFHFSAANSIIIRPSIGDVRSWWSRRDVFVILQVEHDLPYNSNSLAIYSSLLQMMFWSFIYIYIAGSLTLNPLIHCFMMRETRWDSFICREMDIPLYILTLFLLQTLWLWMTWKW